MFFNPGQAMLNVLFLLAGIAIGAGAFYLISLGFIAGTSITIGIIIGFLAFFLLSVLLNPYL